ncbi:hypothetical protein L6R52_01625 [Myxococcota bacterium]|nr:hypothetical protein [Myxococcota bacterium]
MATIDAPHPFTSRRSRVALLGALLALVPGGCSDDTPPAIDTEVEISVLELDAETSVPFFGMGHGSDDLPYGGKGLITPADAGVLRSASIAFDGVAEGESYRVDYLGYRVLSSFPPRPPADTPWYCYAERATEITRVVSGIRNAIVLEPSPLTNRCTYLAGDRYVVNPSYAPDPYDAHFGSVDEENVLTLFLHGLPSSSVVTITACEVAVDPSCTAPFGLFTELPDGVFTPWPAHTGSGWAREVTVTATGGEAIVFAVVKPGESPMFWELEARYPAGTTPASEIFRVRLSNGNRVELRAE